MTSRQIAAYTTPTITAPDRYVRVFQAFATHDGDFVEFRMRDGKGNWTTVEMLRSEARQFVSDVAAELD